MTEQTLRRWAKYWQKELRLQDWRIEYYLAEPSDLEDETNCGECEAELANKTAIIHVANPSWSQSVVNEREMEISLVHEMIHLLGWGLEPKTIFQQDLFDHMIDVLAEALVKQRRKK